jgi:hypothetical protein
MKNVPLVSVAEPRLTNVWAGEMVGGKGNLLDVRVSFFSGETDTKKNQDGRFTFGRISDVII